MSNNQVANNILEAIEIMVNQKVDPLIHHQSHIVNGIIVGVPNTTMNLTNTYSVDINGSTVQASAVARADNKVYTAKEQVKIWISGNDAVILGTVEEAKNVELQGNDWFEDQYVIDRKKGVQKTFPLLLDKATVLYQKGNADGTDRIDEIGLTDDKLSLITSAITTSYGAPTHLYVEGVFSTSGFTADDSNWDFGLAITLQDKNGGEIVKTLNINYMLGNPFDMDSTKQALVIHDLKALNYETITKVEFFITKSGEDVDESEPSVSLEEICIYCAWNSDQTPDFNVEIVFPQGNTFYRESAAQTFGDRELIIQAKPTFKNNKISDAQIYWFMQTDDLTQIDDARYGGAGWKLLNATSVEEQETGAYDDKGNPITAEVTVITSIPEIHVKESDLFANQDLSINNLKAIFKCVVPYKNYLYVNDNIVITNSFDEQATLTFTVHQFKTEENETDGSFDKEKVDIGYYLQATLNSISYPTSDYTYEYVWEAKGRKTNDVEKEEVLPITVNPNNSAQVELLPADAYSSQIYNCTAKIAKQGEDSYADLIKGQVTIISNIKYTEEIYTCAGRVNTYPEFKPGANPPIDGGIAIYTEWVSATDEAAQDSLLSAQYPFLFSITKRMPSGDIEVNGVEGDTPPRITYELTATYTPVRLIGYYGSDGKDGDDASIKAWDTFNNLTKNGELKGIWYVNADGEPMWNIDESTYNDVKDLYINASLIKTGIFAVGDQQGTTFLADANTGQVLLAGFEVGSTFDYYENGEIIINGKKIIKNGDNVYAFGQPTEKETKQYYQIEIVKEDKSSEKDTWHPTNNLEYYYKWFISNDKFVPMDVAQQQGHLSYDGNELGNSRVYLGTDGISLGKSFVARYDDDNRKVVVKVQGDIYADNLYSGTTKDDEGNDIPVQVKELLKNTISYYKWGNEEPPEQPSYSDLTDPDKKWFTDPGTKSDESTPILYKCDVSVYYIFGGATEFRVGPVVRVTGEVGPQGIPGEAGPEGAPGTPAEEVTITPVSIYVGHDAGSFLQPDSNHPKAQWNPNIYSIDDINELTENSTVFSISNIKDLQNATPNAVVTNVDKDNPFYGWGGASPYDVNSASQYCYISTNTIKTIKDIDGNETSEFLRQWSPPVLYSKYSIDGTDADVTRENVFNALTNHGEFKGVYYVNKDGQSEIEDEDGNKNPIPPSTATDLYINATMIKSGSLVVGDSSGELFNATLGSNLASSHVTIGGWIAGKDVLKSTNDNTFLYSDENGIAASIGGIQRDHLIFKAGNNFGVDNNGGLYSSSGEIGGWTIGKNVLQNKDATVSFFGNGAKVIEGKNVAIEAGSSTIQTIKAISFTGIQSGGWSAIRSIDLSKYDCNYDTLMENFSYSPEDFRVTWIPLDPDDPYIRQENFDYTVSCIAVNAVQKTMTVRIDVSWIQVDEDDYSEFPSHYMMEEFYWDGFINIPVIISSTFATILFDDGTFTSNKGVIGGWTIDPFGIFSQGIGFNERDEQITTYAGLNQDKDVTKPSLIKNTVDIPISFFAGAPGNGSYPSIKNANFAVLMDGSVYTKNLKVNGIGGSIELSAKSGITITKSEPDYVVGLDGTLYGQNKQQNPTIQWELNYAQTSLLDKDQVIDCVQLYSDQGLILKGVMGGLLEGTWNIHREGSTSPVSSDKNKKYNIQDQPEAYSIIFDKLQPVIYQYNNGHSNRVHTGFIAQDIEEAVISTGLTTQDFAAICYDLDENGNKINYGVRYEEIVSMNTYEIQKLKKRIVELEQLLNFNIQTE